MNHSTTGLAHPAADREGGVRMKKRAVMTVTNVHNLQMTAGLADRAAAMARRYDAAGDYNTASGYWAEYHIWLDEYDHWVQMSDRAGC